ncbi:hypothetical protein OSB04_008684 [Centaurea solstitialis]|uniref:Uncharacterized protein n=1 Tax=Centaurea solstitialis TaxID=347529 RepID=A0AA38WTB0_9ASTR|nr:hypothetical protein OSB04_008684 [Centaurea solstitialis]
MALKSGSCQPVRTHCTTRIEERRVKESGLGKPLPKPPEVVHTRAQSCEPVVETAMIIYMGNIKDSGFRLMFSGKARGRQDIRTHAQAFGVPIAPPNADTDPSSSSKPKIAEMKKMYILPKKDTIFNPALNEKVKEEKGRPPGAKKWEEALNWLDCPSKTTNVHVSPHRQYDFRLESLQGHKRFS